MLHAIIQEAPFWLGWLLATAILLFCIYLAWRAWFADRARGRRRCPKCWYDLAYSEGMTCSECGFTASRETDFARTRRHWMRGGIAILLAAVVIVLVYERTMQVGWAGMMPSRALIWTLPVFSTGNNDAVTQLATRLNQGRLSEDNFARLIERCAEGDAGFRPGTEAWANKYGTILNRFRPALAARRSGSELYALEEPLLDLPPVVTLRARNQWPVGSPARIAVQVLNWWPYGSDTQLRITPLMDGAEPSTAYFRGLNPPTTPYSVLTPPLEAGVKEIAFDIEAFRRTKERGDEWEPAGRRRLSVPVTVEGDIAALMTPASDPILDGAVQRSIVGVRRWVGGTVPVRFYVNPGTTSIPPFDGVAVGYKSEILRDGEVVLTDYCWWMGGSNVSDVQFGSWSDEGGLERLAALDMTTGSWQVRVTGDASLAIRAGEASKYWNGTFTIPLSFQQIPALAPEPHWWMDETEFPENPPPGDEHLPDGDETAPDG